MTENQSIIRDVALLTDTIDQDSGQTPAQSNDQPIYASSESTSTLLPRPIASIVSFATATSSLGLRFGGFIGNAAISGARIGTLTSFELGRVVIEGILARAGSDVVGSSRGEQGKAEAEGLLERALSTLHYSITSTSFLVSAAFQIGSTSLSSGLAVSQFFLSGLDAILGDTDTSKAVATIVVLVQREFKNPETGISGEKVGLSDLIVGATAFALLQRWGRKKTDQELQATNTTEVVWDVVVVNDGQERRNLARQRAEDTSAPAISDGHTRRRSVSFVSATGDQEPFEGIGDGASFISTNSSRPFSNAASHVPHPAEEAFRQQLVDHLKPGSSVTLTAESITRDRVTVEIHGDPEAHVEPPTGFTIIAVNRHDEQEGSSTFVFQRRSRKRRHGKFSVEDPSYPDDLDNDAPELFPPLEPNRLDYYQQFDDNLKLIDTTSGNIELVISTDQDASLHLSATRVTANQKRARVPMIPRDEEHPGNNQFLKGSKLGTQLSRGGLDQSPLRKAMSKTKSVKHLVEFWSREKQKQSATGNRAMTQLGDTSVDVDATTQPMPVGQFLSVDVEEPPPHDTIGDRPSAFLTEPRPTSSISHRRHGSSSYSVASENSIVLKSSIEDDDIDDPVPFLQRHGELTGQYPRSGFAANAARFARFSLASYGSNFLRLTGTYSGAELTSPDDTHLPQHHSFSTYTNLPPATVLLSSYVDSPGIKANASEADDGLPLVHYVSLDHAYKAVVLTCRGTLGFEDVLTDMTCDYSCMIWQSKTYQVHKGIYDSAKRLFTVHGGRILSTIKAALDEFEDYGLILCGHSLGGAVASVLTVLLAQRNTTSAGGLSRFVTATSTPERELVRHSLPPNRPIHCYAYGPAACVSPDLQLATRGLVTSIVHGNDTVPYLSLGTLRDFQAVALAFKSDAHVAKAEVRRRVWDGLISGFRNKTASGLGFSQEWLGAAPTGEEEDDHWAWSALKSLRASLLADKLVPPGDVYLVESAPVLQRHAFVAPSAPPPPLDKDDRSGGSSTRKDPDGSGGTAMETWRRVAAVPEKETSSRRSFKPATHITLRHVRDVEKRFGEIRFAAGMFADHFPARYLQVLEDLEKAVGA